MQLARLGDFAQLEDLLAQFAPLAREAADFLLDVGLLVGILAPG